MKPALFARKGSNAGFTSVWGARSNPGRSKGKRVNQQNECECLEKLPQQTPCTRSPTLWQVHGRCRQLKTSLPSSAGLLG